MRYAEQLHERVRGRDVVDEGCGIERIADDLLAACGHAGLRPGSRERADGVPACKEPWDQATADVAGAANRENAEGAAWTVDRSAVTVSAHRSALRTCCC